MRNGIELPSGLILPAAHETALRGRLVDIEDAATSVNCLIAQARAEGMVEALELLKALEAGQIERMYLLIEDVTNKRLAVLGAMQ